MKSLTVLAKELELHLATPVSPLDIEAYYDSGASGDYVIKHEPAFGVTRYYLYVHEAGIIRLDYYSESLWPPMARAFRPVLHKCKRALLA